MHNLKLIFKILMSGELLIMFYENLLSHRPFREFFSLGSIVRKYISTVVIEGESILKPSKLGLESGSLPYRLYKERYLGKTIITPETSILRGQTWQFYIRANNIIMIR
jgi:hypothetical protein